MTNEAGAQDSMPDPATPPNTESIASGTGSEAEEGLAIGIIVLGVSLLIMGGCFHFMIGLSALFNESFYEIRSGYDLAIDETTWAWIHIVGGVVMALAGTFLIVGARWAWNCALGIAVLSMIWSFYSIPYYPLWALMIIPVDIAFIWAVAAHGAELRSILETEESAPTTVMDQQYYGA